MSQSDYRPDIAIHPGKTLSETISALNMKQSDFAKRTGLTPKTVNEIVKGANPITPDSAVKFAAVVGTSPSFWNNLQRNYDETVVRLKAEENIAEEVPMQEWHKGSSWRCRPWSDNTLGYIRACSGEAIYGYCDRSDP